MESTILKSTYRVMMQPGATRPYQCYRIGCLEKNNELSGYLGYFIKSTQPGFVMNDNSPFLELARSADEAVGWLETCLVQAGVQVKRTFDLRSVAQGEARCPYPQHSAQGGDCQMVVMLAYYGDRGPVSIIAHGHDTRTWFTLVDSVEQPADPCLVVTIRQAVIGALASFVYQEEQAPAS
jgi:hypothetical protein